VLVSIAPSLLSYVTLFEIDGQATISKGNIIIMAVVGLFVAKAAPIAGGDTSWKYILIKRRT